MTATQIACITVQLNPKQMLADLKSIELKHGEQAFHSSDSGLLGKDVDYHALGSHVEVQQKGQIT